MAAAKKVLVIGGGIGGAALGCGLVRAGIETRIIESGRRSDRLGTGICLLGNALRALDKLGLATTCIDRGFGYDSITNYDAAGNVLNRSEAPRTYRPDTPGAIGIMRPVLADIFEGAALAGGARISYETKAAEIVQDGDGVTVHLSDETIERCDLVVAADGAYSSTRATVFGSEFQPSYVGQGVWRYTVPRPSTMTGLEFYRAQSGEVVGGIPLSDALCYYFFLENSPTPVRMAPNELGDLLRARMEPFTAPALRDAVALISGSDNISFRPFDVLLMPQPWHKGRVVLLGDAAHSLTPQLTSGGGMAIEDAAVLAEELAGHSTLPPALAAYGDRRGARVGTVFANSLQICRWEQEPLADKERSMALMMQSYQFLGQPC